MPGKMIENGRAAETPTETDCDSTVGSAVSSPVSSPTGGSSTVHWDRLYDEIGERLFRLLHRMLGDPDEASDLTHDAFVRIHQSRLQFAHRGPLHAWAFRIAANLGRDALRRRTTRRRYVQGELERDRAPGTRHDVARISLGKALEKIDDPHRTVLLLHDVDGYTHPEIAEMLAIAVGTSKARLSRARRAMRSALGATARPSRARARTAAPEPRRGGDSDGTNDRPSREDSTRRGRWATRPATLSRKS